jgi:tRNA pseudouridine38-40 synthase
MPRYFIDISFDGTAYHGWQRQKNGLSIQQVLEEKFSSKLHENIEITGCGRTDTGVHARQYIAHFDYTKTIAVEDFSFNMNRFLPHDISLNKIFPVIPEAHARFSAIERTYKYYIIRKKNPFYRNYHLELTMLLDVHLMNEACVKLLQTSDFTSFSKLHGGQKDNICTLTECFWKENGDQLIFTISANRFTRNMVRAIVGTMLEIGKQKLSLTEFQQIINSKNRCLAGESVDAKGLFLEKVIYPKDIYS